MTAVRTLPTGTWTTGELEVRKSRFLCTLAGVRDEEGARATIAEVRRQHRDAGHQCTAFVLGRGRELTRTSDDGEPSGTAGQPMLNALLSHGGEYEAPLTDVLAVVSRWFGGTKLGTGGLARAYGQAVGHTLDLAPLVTVRARPVFRLTLPLAHLGIVQNALATRGAEIELVDCTGELATATVTGSDDPAGTLEAVVARTSQGQATLVRAGTSWG